jgi:flagellar motor component MotA
MTEIDFMKEYNAVFERSLIFSIVARSMGIVPLENLLDKEKINQRDIFEFGMRMVVHGRQPEQMDKIFTNLINLETDKEKKIIKNMQKDAVLSIQQGDSPEQLMWILNSYVNIDLDKATEKYNELNDCISKEFSNVYLEDHDKFIEKNKQFAEKVVNIFYKCVQ